MNTGAVIDVGLGVALMYLILSLMCTIINEYIAGWTNVRAKTLASGIEGIIDNPTVLQAFKEHGLICSAFTVTGHQPSYLAGKAVAAALLESLDPNRPVAAVADVKAAAESLPDSNIRDVVLSAVSGAGNDLDKLRLSIASWFDDSMDRLSGVYQRYARNLSLVVGVLLAVALNADTIAVANSLWDDGTLRAQLVQMANSTVADDKKLNVPTNQVQKLQGLKAEESDLRPFPIGWTQSSLPFSDNKWKDAWIAIVKIVGLLITGLALSLGAPFWFDLLKGFINLRTSGVKPKPSR